MGKHGLGRRNDEGQAVADFSKRVGLDITNSFFVKKAIRRITLSAISYTCLSGNFVTLLILEINF